MLVCSLMDSPFPPECCRCSSTTAAGIKEKKGRKVTVFIFLCASLLAHFKAGSESQRVLSPQSHRKSAGCQQPPKQPSCSASLREAAAAPLGFGQQTLALLTCLAAVLGLSPRSSWRGAAGCAPGWRVSVLGSSSGWQCWRRTQPVAVSGTA